MLARTYAEYIGLKFDMLVLMVLASLLVMLIVIVCEIVL